jgi:hypothetical protein
MVLGNAKTAEEKLLYDLMQVDQVFHGMMKTECKYKWLSN